MAVLVRHGKASHVHPRYTQARGLGPAGITPPLLVDRHTGRLTPLDAETWYHALPPGWRQPLWVLGGAALLAAGLAWWCAPLGGVPWAAAALMGSREFGRLSLGFSAGAGVLTQQAIALSGASGYTYGSAGTAVGIRGRPMGNETLNSAYVYVTAFTGTPANVNDLNFELRNDTSNKPGTTLHASGTTDPSGITAPAWVGVTGLSQALTGATAYWGTWTDADQNATDFATIMRNVATAPFNTLYEFGDRDCGSSTNGWSTITNTAAIGSIVLGCASGVVFGNPFVAASTATSNTNRKGLNLSVGMTESIKCLGMIYNPLTNVSGMELRTGGDGASFGTSVFSTVIPSIASGLAVGGYLFNPPQTLTKATPYRIVYTYAGASTVPRRLDIGTGANATLALAMPGGGGMYWAEANGTTDWSLDNTLAWPQTTVLFEDQVAVSSEGRSRHYAAGARAAARAMYGQ